MQAARDIIDRSFPEMRWRALSLAADLDRIARGADGAVVLGSDPRVEKLRSALRILIEPTASADRTEQIQMIFSDTSPGPR